MRPDGTATWIGRSVFLVAGLLLAQIGSAGAQQNIPKADVMFVLDITGTMQGEIDGVTEGLERILKKLKDNQIDAHVGLTVFRDEKNRNANDKAVGITDDPFTFTFGGPRKHFTESQKEFRDIVSKLKAQGGGDVPENSLQALKLAAEAGGRQRATRVMVLITDAPPHPGATLKDRIKDTRQALAKNNWDHVYLITMKGEDRKLYEQIWNQEKGVHGAWFELQKTKAAFAKLLDSITEHAVTEIKKKPK